MNFCLALLAVCLGILILPKLSFGNSIKNQLETPIASARTGNYEYDNDSGSSATPVFIAGPITSLIFLCCLGFCCYRCCCQRNVVVVPAAKSTVSNNCVSQVTVVAPTPAPAPAQVQPIFIMPQSTMAMPQPQYQNQAQTSFQASAPAPAPGGEPPKYYP